MMTTNETVETTFKAARLKREDVHRPTAIIPEDYEFVALECIKIESIGDCFALQAQRERLRAHMARTGGTYSRHDHGGNCGVCGNANAIYTIQFYHAKTNSYVRMGQDCADKVGMSFGEGEFNAFVKGIRSAIEAKAGKKKAEALLAERGLSRCWELYLMQTPGVACGTCEQIAAGQVEYFYHRCANDWPEQETIIRDMVGKLVKYGSLSDKQYGFMSSLLDRIVNRDVINAKRAEEKALAPDCPSGRVTITGTVLSAKTVETDFGMTTKIFLKDDRGFTVYGTIPTIRLANITRPDGSWSEAYHNAGRGDRIRFSANVTPANDDPKHGFYKRPTKGELVQAAETAE